MTTTWAQVLHFYQPPTQTHDVLRRVVEESYRLVLSVLEANPHARIGVNIQGVLVDLLVDHGLGDVVERLDGLVSRGQVELLGSGRFHAILPLMPEAYRRRSIAEQADTLRRHFPALAAAKLDEPPGRLPGFFPPEMCWSSDLAAPIAEAGHRWVALSGVACPGPWPTGEVLRTNADGRSLAVLFRDDVRSNRISFRQTDPERFLGDIAGLAAAGPSYVVTAMDAETYGHHIKGWERDFLDTAYRRLAPESGPDASRVVMATPSEVVERFPAGRCVTPHASSWSTTPADLAAGNPYPLWQAPGNRTHALQWEYVDHCLTLVGAADAHAATAEARKYASIAAEAIEPALHSCQFWWASRLPMWDVSMIHRGLQLLTVALLNASKSIQLGEAPLDLKREARWRIAAAAEVRSRLEHELFVDDAP